LVFRFITKITGDGKVKGRAYYPRILLEGLRVTTKIVGKNSLFCGEVSNQALPNESKWSPIAEWYSAELRAGCRGFESRQGLGIFLFTTMLRSTLGPIKPPIQWLPGALSLGVKWPEYEADHSPPAIAEVKIAWSYTTALLVRLHGVVLS
jgi:hypothetical protein